MALRYSQAGASLELMLDTICNVFGGIVLMAILVVIQTQSTAARIPTPGSEDLDRIIEARRLAFEKEQLEREILDMQSQLAAVMKIEDTGGDGTTPLIIERYAEFRDAIAKAVEKLEQQERQTEKEQQTLLAVKQDQSRAFLRLKSQQQGIRELKQQLLDLAQRPRRNIRLPHRKGAARGKARYYVIKDNKLFGAGVGVSRWDGPPYVLEDCQVTPVPGDILALALQPLTDKGIALPGPGQPLAPVVATLRGCTPQTHYCIFFVYRTESSYDSFQRMRKVVSDLGYRYGVGALNVRDGPVILKPTSYHETE